MKISEYENEEALDLLCDILEPTAVIFADPQLEKAINSGANKIKLVTTAIKNHKEEVLTILARLDNVPREEYSCNTATIIKKLVDIISDKELVDFFTSSGQTEDKTSSTVPTANTKGSEK